MLIQMEPWTFVEGSAFLEVEQLQPILTAQMNEKKRKKSQNSHPNKTKFRIE